MGDLGDTVVVVTGANSGLGRCSADALAAHGATVVMACRNPDRAADAFAEVRARATGAEPILQTVDLSDLASVRVAADQLGSRLPRIDVLMNNAGVMAIPLERTAQGHEMQFGTNHLGHFALTGLLLPLLLAAPSPRVVTTSSMAHRIGKMRWDDLDWHHGYRRWSAYGQSKLANLLFTYELDVRARSNAVALHAMAAHPGYASTHLQAVGPERSGNRFMARSMSVANRLFAQSAEMGALPQLFAGVAPDAIGGAYYGPDGMGEQRGHPTMVTSSSASRRVDDWRRLWERSEEMTGVGYSWS